MKELGKWIALFLTLVLAFTWGAKEGIYYMETQPCVEVVE